MEGRDYGDNQILQMTVQEREGKTVRFKTELPGSGRTVVSEWMNPDDAKGGTMISWCENIRQQIDADAREHELKRKRDRDMAAVKEDVELKEEQVEDVTNPIEYATRQRDMYQERVNILEERIEADKQERKRMREHLEQWQKILTSLMGETDE
jgi:peptidoglycan hydrolase CwlO-like protein